jgi:glycosyltransferase involved in cell wall biosynthesis
MRSDKLRIAQVAPLWTSIPPETYGGIELLIYMLVEELVRRGHEVTLFATDNSKTSARLHPICNGTVTDAMIRGKAHGYEHYSTAALVEAIKARDSFDVIHSHIGTSVVPLNAVSNVPIVHTIHTVVGPDDQWVFDHYPDVPLVGLSHSQVSAFTPECRGKVHVVHNACDIDRYDLADPPGDYLMFLGRMSPQKNPVDAIRIARAAGMPIVLAGSPQSRWEEQYFAEQVEPLIDGNNVRYAGGANHEQKRALLRNAAALLFPIQWAEPFGLVMIEALASGLPVLAFNNGSVSELIDYGVTGFYADSVEALVPLVPEALKLDRRAIREGARRRFSHHRYVDEYLDVYRATIQHA